MRILRQAEQFPWRCAATYYHTTDQPDFALNPKFKPENLAEEDEGHYGPGLFVSRDKDLWRDPYGYGDRKHVVEFEGPDDLHTLPGVRVPYQRRPTPGADEYFVPAAHFNHLRQRSITSATGTGLSRTS